MEALLVDRLNELLAAERAGVEAVAHILKDLPNSYSRNELEKMGKDEAWSCAGLEKALRRLGGQPTDTKGDFAQKIAAQRTFREQLQLMSRGQAWVNRRIDAILAGELDMETRRFLEAMRDAHRRNIAWCDEMTQVKELAELPIFPSAPPAFDAASWRLTVDGLVASPVSLDYEGVKSLAVLEDSSAFECLDGWRVPGNRWKGIPVSRILDLVSVLPEARFVTFHSGAFAMSLTLDEARSPGFLLAYDLNGSSLTHDHGAPLRLVAPNKECFYGIKWVERIELTAQPVNTGETIAIERIRGRPLP